MQLCLSPTRQYCFSTNKAVLTVYGLARCALFESEYGVILYVFVGQPDWGGDLFNIISFLCMRAGYSKVPSSVYDFTILMRVAAEGDTHTVKQTSQSFCTHTYTHSTFLTLFSDAIFMRCTNNCFGV